MKRPLIVITPQSRTMEPPYEGDYHYSSTFNTSAILEAGGLPVIPPFLDADSAEDLLSRADGLFMTGGADVSPSLYGEETLEACGPIQPGRDASDRLLMETALRLRKPILCVCRGFQLANVLLGGTLYQDLDTQHPGGLAHVARTSECYRAAVHTVRVEPDTPLRRLLSRDTLGVNTLHHQAVKALAPCLKPMAWSPDGLIEGWYLPGEEQWLRGYQWHPEMMLDETQRTAVFRDFLDACRK